MDDQMSILSKPEATVSGPPILLLEHLTPASPTTESCGPTIKNPKNWKYTGPALEVSQTGISQPPFWRKGPPRPLKKGETCWVLTFEDWPKVTLHVTQVLAVDLIDRVYVVDINSRKWVVSAERVFHTYESADAEKSLHEKFNYACYELEAHENLQAETQFFMRGFKLPIPKVIGREEQEKMNGTGL